LYADAIGENGVDTGEERGELGPVEDPDEGADGGGAKVAVRGERGEGGRERREVGRMDASAVDEGAGIGGERDGADATGEGTRLDQRYDGADATDEGTGLGPRCDGADATNECIDSGGWRDGRDAVSE